MQNIYSSNMLIITMSIQDELKASISNIEQLKNYTEVSPKEEKQLQKVIERHPMRITPYYLSLINWDDPNDPIKKTAVPSITELNLLGTYDTSGEAENTKMPGLQHKYTQTALVLATNRCAMYCRYCFRKRLVGLQTEEIIKRFNNAVKYIKEHEEINNVLISGGDPLVLPTKIIEKFLKNLSPISHLDFIRFGTRVPVTFPDRLLEDDDLVNLLGEYSWENRRIYVVTQYNHPREVTDKAIKAVDKILHAGVIVNNQSILLRGVNNDPEILAQLQNKLVSIGVNPYYVFQCRPVKRVKHSFQVPLYEGYQIVEDAKRRLNGLSKRFKYIMSHKTGKIEIVGIADDKIFFKYHQAKNPKNIGRFFERKLSKSAGWLDELN